MTNGQIDREAILASNPLGGYLASIGVIKHAGAGRHAARRCPLKEHRTGHNCVSVDLDKNLWNCHDCKSGGTIIDWIMLESGRSNGEVMRELSGQKTSPPPKPAESDIETIYSYQNASGDEVFQCLRMKPKSFRQRHMSKTGWQWNLDGVNRVLYRLPEVMAAQEVWFVEGEKDADLLRSIGIVTTTNPMGAGKWLDAYTDSLAGKDVILCGDNDAPGLKHTESILKSIAGRVKTARQVKIPKEFKDVSEFRTAFGDVAAFKARMEGLKAESIPFIRGVQVPVHTLHELEDSYSRHCLSLKENLLDIGNWLPGFRGKVRGLIPGEVVCIIAATAVGKTAILQNLALAVHPLPTLFFELELPRELMFERFMAIRTGLSCEQVELAYATGEKLAESDFKTLRHLHICTEPKMSPDKMEEYIRLSELKIGEKPKVVMLDYIQLAKGRGKDLYEQISNTAEELKVVAKSTGTIIVFASQIKRREGETPEVFLHDGKQSGSIENSSGLLLGAWRDDKDGDRLIIKVLKNTKGKPGHTVFCRFNGNNMRIREESRFNDADVTSARNATKD